MTAGSKAARVLGGLAAAPLLVGWAAAPAWAASSAPPGNNGTIKVDGQPFDQGHDNEPHPGCTFRLTFFGFDAGANTAAITFDAHPPTGSTELRRETFTFTDTRDHGGATFDAASPEYDLSQELSQFSAAKQGYHVKVSVSVNGGNPKHKVFWIDSCHKAATAPAAPASSSGPAAAPAQTQQAPPAQKSAAPASAPATTSAPAPAAALGMMLAAPATPGGMPATAATDTTSSAGSTTSATTEALTAAYVGAGSRSTSAPAEVLGVTVTRSPSTAPSSASGGLLAFTGFNALLWSLVGLAALGSGLLMRRLGRRPLDAA